RWNNNDNRPDRGNWGRDRRDDDRRWNNNDGNRPDRNGWNRDRRDNDRRWNNDNNRPGRNDWGRDRRNDDRRWSGSDNRRWDRNDWRRDNRYDWQRYRDRNRSIYRIGGYYAPYRDYSYRRLSIGFSLGSLFYGSNYWINDPWQYRLPPVYGAYRWVRYYDDVLLVDTYSGEVVDVIYDFFW
ncbi:RcnB family protein, partial [Novosphingobium lindaniclasticum]